MSSNCINCLISENKMIVTENIAKKYLAFVLDNKSREKLIAAFPPSFDTTVCHHVTIKFNDIDIEDVEKYHDITRATVVGIIAEEDLEALVVNFASTTTREDGGTYHITHSLTKGKKKPFDSNKLLKKKDFVPVPHISISGTVQLENK